VTAAGIREIVQTVLTHRIIVRKEPEYKNVTPAEVVQEILEQIPVPG